MRRRRAAAAVLLALLLPAAARAAELIPVLEGTFLLGQLFQGGKASDWQGNASVNATPAVRFNDQWGLIPTYAASYNGTRSVTDLGSGGQLFQDGMSHALLLKGIWRRDERLKLKPSLGYRWELLRETSQESWGKGLFDYRKPSAGVEGEWTFSKEAKASLAFDWYQIRFPNYRSLESGQAQNGLARENADGRPLDSNNLSWTLSGQFPLPFEGGSARLALNTTSRSYGDQHVVLRSGSLSPQTRTDGLRTASGTMYYGKALDRRLSGQVSLLIALTRARADQNFYDAEFSVFSSDYYSFDERTLSPRLSLLLGEKKVQLSVGYMLIHRDYTGRQAQDAAGGYLGKAVNLEQQTFMIDLSLPMRPGLKLIAHTAMTTASSNMRYEKTFKYNYSLSNHLIGVSYSY